MSTQVPSNRYCSVEQYAKIHRMSKPGIYKAIKEGRLKAYKVDKMYLIPVNAPIESSRIKDGSLIGISDLKRGDLESFLRKRGIKQWQD